MAHEFKIMNTSGTVTTYTDYDLIPIDSTLKHVISFKPDLGRVIESLSDYDDTTYTLEVSENGDYKAFPMISRSDTGSIVLNGDELTNITINGLSLIHI